MDTILLREAVTSVNKKISRCVFSFSFLLARVALFCVPAVAHSAPWEFGVDIDLGVIYTDNIFLDQDGLEESEIVYTIVPEFYLTSDGDRIDADIRYRPEAYFYQTYSDADTVFHVVDATMTSALVREKLFLFLSASNFQSIIVPEMELPTGNVPITSNRVDARILEARPYWQQRIGSADFLLEADYTDIRYDDDLFQNSTIKRGKFELDNIERQQGLAWGVSYDHALVEYESSLPWEYQRAALEIGYWINVNFRIFTVGGAETDLEKVLEPNLDAEFWEAGFQYTPSQRLNLEAAWGDRYHGSSFRLNFDYTLRRGLMALSYYEEPTTRAQLPPGQRPINDKDNLDGILDRPGRSDQFLRRRLDLVTIIKLVKSELSLRVFGERREQRTSADGMPLADEDYVGAALRWRWNLGVKTALGLGGDISRLSSDATRGDDLLRYFADLTYRFSERISLRGEIIHSSQQGRELSDFAYDENQFRLLLHTEF